MVSTPTAGVSTHPRAPQGLLLWRGEPCHETACALRDTGDLPGAAQEFSRSIRTRDVATFTRTHAVTLGYLGAVQAASAIEEASSTWSNALDAMQGINSGRTRQVAIDMSLTLAPYCRRGMNDS